MQKTMIPVRNWTILEERVGFLQLQSNFNQMGGLYNENDNDKYIKITLPPFDPTNETYDLFLELQNEVVEKEIAHRFAFTFIVNAAEYYMIPCLQKYIKPKFFGSSATITAKSILWMQEHKHQFQNDTFDSYFQYAAEEFDTKTINLRYSYILPNWLQNYNNLKAHLIYTRRDKKKRLQHNFKHTCIKCKMVQEFDGRALLYNHPLRCMTEWWCDACLPPEQWPVKQIV